MTVFQWISSSLRAKLLTMFVILTAVPLVFVGLVSYQKSYQSISEHSKASTLLAADQLARNIDVLFEDTQRLLEFGKNPQVLHFLFSQSETYDEAKDILQTFALYRETYKYENVLNISMINLYGKGISERKGVFQFDLNPLRNPHFQTLMQSPDTILKIPPSSHSEYDRLDGFTYPDKNVISIMAAIKQQITHEVIGFIVIDLDDSVIEQFCNSTIIGKTGFFFIQDPDGQPIYVPPVDEAAAKILASTPPATWGNPDRDSFVLPTDGKPFFVVHTASESTGWNIVGLAPLQEIVAEAQSIRQLIIVTVILTAIFAITLYFFLTQRLVRPVRLLQSKMRQAASGYLEAKVKSTGKDEIGDLGNSFNIMLEKIKVLLENSIKEQEQLQKAELRTLQAQIHPHFLYNTLDSIVWMAEAGKNESVVKLVKALSQFFRLSLNKGRDWISIKTELEHGQSYLVIQQMRYRDILDYDIRVPDELKPYAILKMTLQPLIENAIYHGIKNKRGKGLVTIDGYIENDRNIVLIVEDNGAGMKPERLAYLREKLDSPIAAADESQDGSEGGFGLQNVHQRLRLYFGSPYGVELESTEGVGSRVSIRIPKK
ncbi:two-component system sensor histidine kinase YesM [Paenibacillus phyllosphaerae]|uniref:histidine kinase n=1 Tax=Paenibacillus phyllosphaerae TaxID=274593 RepID=A0A7W5B393_9BACL|nr:sensor histidine kinase [Paenibacillus phyllosphaerae]MBB3112881.1 two-component system sensor histidine kinase YesM [Paenibacillus phyllosphaerae]